MWIAITIGFNPYLTISNTVPDELRDQKIWLTQHRIGLVTIQGEL